MCVCVYISLSLSLYIYIERCYDLIHTFRHMHIYCKLTYVYIYIYTYIIHVYIMRRPGARYIVLIVQSGEMGAKLLSREALNAFDIL